MELTMKKFMPFAILVLASVSMTWAQVTTATLYGIVQDQSGAVNPGAEVTLTHQATGAVHKKLTGDTGEFVFDFLPVGSYTLKIESAGFKTYVSRGIQLVAGQKVRQTYILTVGEIAETVTVESGAPLVNTVSPEQRETIDRLQIAELPVARRNITNVLRLATGVDISGHTRSLRINGVGKHGTGVSVDGTDANSNPEGRGVSQYQGINYVDVMSIDAVQEVEVVRGILPAEYGGVLGGQVNLISKSGTNAWHGSLFESYQSHLFNARHPFVPTKNSDGSLTSKPRQVFNQFGGSIGGPILRDKAFIFGAYEGYRESTFQALSAQVPTQRFRDQILRALPAPETRIALDTLPLPTQLTNEDVGLFFGAGNHLSRDNHFVVKGDLRVSDTGNFSVTYTRNRPFVLEPRFNVNHSNDRFWKTSQDRVTANYTISKPGWTSESRLGINRVYYLRQDNFLNVKDPSNPAERNRFGRRVPLISVSGLFSTPRGEMWDMWGPTYSFDQKFAHHMGQHLFKFGGKYIFYGGGRIKLANPQFFFQNKADVLGNRLRNIETTLGAPPHKSRMHEFGFFAQDDWRISPKLVLNLGLRYDFYSHVVVKPTTDVPVGIYNPAPPRDWSRFDFGPFSDPTKPYKNDGWVNLGPRFGFAYNPRGDGKTVLRGGFGVLFSPHMPALVRQSVGKPNEPFRVLFSKAEADSLGLRWPFYNDQLSERVQVQAASTGRTFVFSILNPNLQNPYTMHYQLNLERELAPNLVLETGFVGVRGVKFIMHRRFNQPDRVTGLRPNPNLVVGGYYVDNSQNMVYSAWQTSLRKRFSHNLAFDAHYTFSKGLAVDGGDIGAYYQGDVFENIQNFFNPRADRGPVIGDTTHRFIADWVYELPHLSSLSNPILRHVVGGWEISGILAARTGGALIITQPAPEDVPSRPDYAGGNPVVSDWRGTVVPIRCAPGAHCSLQYLNVNAFARVPVSSARLPIRPGNVGTGLVRGPGSWATDFSLAKNFRVREDVRLQFRVDMFNAFNHVNYAGPDTDVNSPFFGQIRGAGGMRSMQMGARLNF